jgi:hypothetical protein
MISRRGLVAAAAMASLLPGDATQAATLARSALPVPPGGMIAFRLRRRGDVIGSHILSFLQQGTALVVSIAVDILIKFLGIPVYRYSHRASERWLGDQFMSIESRTDLDGLPRRMHAIRQAHGLVVEGSRAESYVAPSTALPATYWNQAMLGRKLINAEDGRLMSVTVTEGKEEEPVPRAFGQNQLARRYSITGDLDLDIWYDDAGQWAHLERITYGAPVSYEKR